MILIDTTEPASRAGEGALMFLLPRAVEIPIANLDAIDGRCQLLESVNESGDAVCWKRHSRYGRWNYAGSVKNQIEGNRFLAYLVELRRSAVAAWGLAITVTDGVIMRIGGRIDPNGE